MGTQIQYRRGTAAQNNAFTGALGEVTVDTTNGILRVHDGVTAGGNTLVSLIATQTLTNKTFGGNLTASGNIVLAGNLIATSTLSSTSSTTGVLIISGGVGIAGNLNAGTGASASSTHLILGNLSVNGNIVNGGTSGVGNIGATGKTFNTVFALATSAQYADLAEVYRSDINYSPGTVVVFGGEFEITQSILSHDNRIAGVISTRPAHLMNSAAEGLPVALTGRVPCRVLGPVNKGDSLVASQHAGVAQRLNQDSYVPGCIIGKALQVIESADICTIEVVVGRL